MIVNHRRGEVSAKLGGTERRLCLTLGALAQLEADFGVEDLQALGSRFANARLSARDLVTLLHAGLCGGGNTLSREEVEQLDCEGGLRGYAEIVSKLLAVTFGDVSETAHAKS
ncbi:MAG: gene transfer agent family protein [Pseudomonadota bacterium]